MMGLRLKEGVDLERYAALNGTALSGHRIAELVDLGMAEINAGKLIILDQGVIVLNAILSQLLVD